MLFVGKVNYVTFASLRSIVYLVLANQDQIVDWIKDQITNALKVRSWIGSRIGSRIRSRIGSRTRSRTVHSFYSLNVICSTVHACYTVETDCSVFKCSFSQLAFNILLLLKNPPWFNYELIIAAFIHLVIYLIHNVLFHPYFDPVIPPVIRSVIRSTIWLSTPIILPPALALNTNLGLDNSRRYDQPHSTSFNNFATPALPWYCGSITLLV